MKILKKEITYTWIKDNLGAIILIPTLLGGIWQIIELLMLGVPFIRFFSVSQLVSDGLLILSILAFCAFGIFLVARTEIITFIKLLLKTEEKSENSDNIVNDRDFFLKDENIDKQKRIFNYFLFSVMLALTFYWIYIYWFRQQSRYLIDWNRITPYSIIGFFMWVGSVFIILGGLTISFLGILEKKFNVRNRYVRRSGPLLFSLLLIPVLFYGGQSLRLFHNSFLMPENLRNKDYLEQQVKANNPHLEGWNIVYYNDKFVFVSIENSSCKQLIEVLEFDAMFSENPK